MPKEQKMDVNDLDERGRKRYYTVSEISTDSIGGRKLAIRRASAKLGCSEKTVERLLVHVEKGDVQAFVHGNKGRKPKTAFPQAVKDAVIALYRKQYRDASYRHFVQILDEDYGIAISDQTLHRWLKGKKLLSPRSQRKTRRNMLEAIRKEAEETDDKKVLDSLAKEAVILDRRDAHPLRPRSKYMGQLVQMDASEYRWNGRSKWHLHLAVDDATGHVVGAYFDHQETLNGYYHVLRMILVKYGIPVRFYTDRRTVFEYERLNKADRLPEKDTLTQFAHACQILGISLSTTSVPEAKGLIERMNQTFQNRLSVDLRRAGITDIDEANRFLEQEYLDYFNAKFSDMTEKDLENSVFVEAPAEEDINHILAVVAERTVAKGHVIRFFNKVYFPVKGSGEKVYFAPKTKGYVIRAFDGGLFFNVDDVLYALEETEKRSSYSEEFDDESQKPKPRKKYIPPLDHPWRQANLKFNGCYGSKGG